MLEKYGTKGEVWSNYLKRCLKHKTCVFPPSLNLNRKKAKAIRLLLEAELDDEADDEAVPDGTSNEAADEGDFPFPSQGEISNTNQHNWKILVVMCCLCKWDYCYFQTMLNLQ